MVPRVVSSMRKGAEAFSQVDSRGVAFKLNEAALAVKRLGRLFLSASSLALSRAAFASVASCRTLSLPNFTSWSFDKAFAWASRGASLLATALSTRPKCLSNAIMLKLASKVTTMARSSVSTPTADHSNSPVKLAKAPSHMFKHSGRVEFRWWPLFLPVGRSVGKGVGKYVGKCVGMCVGTDVGCGAGKIVGAGKGTWVGVAVGWGLGSTVGKSVGSGVGCLVGACVGTGVGAGVGLFVGLTVGSGVGTGDGKGVGPVVGTGVGK